MVCGEGGGWDRLMEVVVGKITLMMGDCSSAFAVSLKTIRRRQIDSQRLDDTGSQAHNEIKHFLIEI